MLKIAKEGEVYRVELFQVNRFNTLFSGLVKEQLAELVGKPGSEVVFNLKGIRFIDSAGFEVLTRISDLASAAGSSFKLCNVGDDVKELLLLMELEGKFPICSCGNTAERILLTLD